jgi:hypothetical protein
MKRVFIFAAALAAFLAAGSSLAGDIEILLSGTHATLTDQEYKDIHSADDLKAFWNEAFGKMTSQPKIPDMDFTKQMVLAVFIGSQQHEGNKVRVSKFDDSGDTFNVTVEVEIPCHLHPSGPHGVQPYVIVAVPATTKAVNFDTKQRNEMC